MDPFTLALATFGVQKLRGKSTRTALKDAALVGGTTYGLGKLGGIESLQGTQFGSMTESFRNPAFSSIPGVGDSKFLSNIRGQKGDKDLYKAYMDAAKDKGPLTEEGKALLAEAKKIKPSGIAGLSTTSKLLGASALTPFLMGEGDPVKEPFTEEDYKKAYKEQSKKLEGAFEPASSTAPAMSDVFASDVFYANKGGLAEMVKGYNTGGINYLPSKTDHDENDANNYVRATGYVEDGAGNGDKDEDTMLAQLADGEFVSRADAVLGAGILSGGDPKSYKSMRKAGADFFYDQQKKFKRIFDLLNASKKTEN